MLMSGQDEARKYASALRTLYSAGLDKKGNKTKELTLFEEILIGKTNVVEAPDAEYNAKTEVNETTGIKTITLGKSALENGARFGLNILLGHEAYRNGMDDGKAGQRTETNDAVLGHINIAARLGMTYGMDSLSDNDRTEIDALQKAIKGDTSAIMGILGGYDASADYWRLTNTGKLLYDGKATVIDHETGKVIISAAEMGVNDSDYLGALAKMLGVSQDQARDIMRSTGVGNPKKDDKGAAIQIGGGNTKTPGMDVLYQQALINMVKYGGKSVSEFPLESPYVAYNGSSVNILKNYMTMLEVPGGAKQVPTIALSMMGKEYTDSAWNSVITDPSINPFNQAVSNGLYDMGNPAGFDRYVNYLDTYARIGDPEYVEHSLGMYSAGVALGQTAAMGLFTNSIGTSNINDIKLSNIFDTRTLIASSISGFASSSLSVGINVALNGSNVLNDPATYVNADVAGLMGFLSVPAASSLSGTLSINPILASGAANYAAGWASSLIAQQMSIGTFDTALAIPSGAISGGAAMIGSILGSLVSTIGQKANITLSDVFYNPWANCTVNGIKTNTVGYGLPLYNFSYIKDPLWQFVGRSIVDPYIQAFNSTYFNNIWNRGW